MNPIEHLWDEVERRMKKEQPKNEKELREALNRVWNEIEKGTLKKLVDSVPYRLNEILRMRGYPTRYYWVDAKVSADFFSFLCFKFLLKQNTINQQRIYHCYLRHTPIY